MQERDHTTGLNEQVVTHYKESYTEDWFTGRGNVTLRYTCKKLQKAKKALVILGGRTEFIEKYQEIFFDLRNIDFAIYSFDHRGQGLSDRLVADGQMGHVESFNDYICDVKIFLDNIVVPEKYNSISILGFSMGAAISMLFNLQHPHYLKSAILCCPMMAIYTYSFPQNIIGWLAENMVKKGRADEYVVLGKPFDTRDNFANNPFTSSRIRHAINKQMVLDNLRLAVGSPTWNWVFEATKYSNLLLERASEIALPLLLLQGGGDKIVNNAAQDRFSHMASNCSLERIEGSRHELLMETDELRDQALSHIKSFLAKI